MTEGTVPVPPGRPWAQDSDGVPVPYRMLGKPEAAGVKPLESVQLVIEHFLWKLYYSNRMQGLLPLSVLV